MIRSKIFGFWSVIAVLLLWQTVATAAYEKTLKKRFDAREGGTLLLKTDRGSVNIGTHDRDEVYVEIRQKVRRLSRRDAKALLQDIEYTFESDGRDVTIQVDLPKEDSWFGSSRWNNLQLHFDVLVPRTYDVVVKTAGGSIEVADLRGDVNVRTSGGHLRFGNIDGSIEGRTSGGSIEVEACRGRVTLRTSGGSIKLGRIDGEVNARTSGGSVEIERAEGRVDVKTSGGNIVVRDAPGAVQAITSGGSIRAYINAPVTEECALTTSGGNITVYISPDARFHLIAKTSGGTIVSDLPITVQGKLSKRSVEGDFNGGGPTLTLKTSGGSIYLREK